MNRATPDDIARIWKQLWGDCPASVVDEYYQASEQPMRDGSTQGMILDRTQITDEMMYSCDHLKVRVRHDLFRPAGLYEPAEYITIATCVYCDAVMDGDDIPDDAEVIAEAPKRF